MFFSTNTKDVMKAQNMDLWRVRAATVSKEIFGTPTLVGKNKRAVFFYIKYKMWKEIQGWKEKLLSQGGQEVLIKVVAMSIPTYSISCFKLPKNLCDELKRMIASF